MRVRALSAVFIIFVLVGSLAGCVATVDVTKTAKGFYNPTDPNEVDILLTRPEKSFTELGTVTVRNFRPTDTAEMHNAIRAKVAPLGANAAILTSQGIDANGLMWAMGVAIRYKTGDTQE
jgi:hypothetical protein